MDWPSGRTRALVAGLGVILAGGVLTVAQGYSPPFVVNQHTYLLHGVANAGVGHLHADALVRSADGLPLFSLLVEGLFRLGGERLLLLPQILLNSVYVLALALIGRHLCPRLARPEWMSIYLCVLLALHSAASTAFRFGGFSPRRSLTGGIAGFNLMTGYFVQQNFGALLVLSIAVFLRGHHYLAGVLIAAAAAMHPVYLLPGAALTLAYVYVIVRRDEDWRQALLLGGLTLVLVLPQATFLSVTFGTAPGESVAKAHELLATVRSPHHSLPSSWLWSESSVLRFDPAFKLGLLALAILCVRRNALAPILAIPLALTAIAIGWVALTHDHSVAVLYPWRSVVILVPVATASLTALLVGKLPRAPLERASGRRLVLALSLLAVGLLVVKGAQRSVESTAARAGRPWVPVESFVRGSATVDDLYLVPPIPRSFQGFRIESGARTFVDWKSPPYDPVDMLAWYARIRAAARAYRGAGTELSGCAALPPLVRDHDITHVVTSTRNAACPDFERIYSDAAFAVYRHVGS